jgi:transcriptional regulator with XRE-family HTH domain
VHGDARRHTFAERKATLLEELDLGAGLNKKAHFRGAKGDFRLKRLGRRVRDERLRRGFSLEELSALCRVSRSMISAVERGAKAATVLVLDRISTGLGTSLARLLDEEAGARVILLRRNRQKVARTGSDWERRILSPVLPGVEFEFMRTTLGPGVDAGVFLPHAHGSREYVAVERGSLELTLDGEVHTLRAGDSIYYDGDCMHGFKNPRGIPCVYYLAMDVSGDRDGTQHHAAPEEAAASIRKESTEARGGKSRGGRGRVP